VEHVRGKHTSLLLVIVGDGSDPDTTLTTFDVALQPAVLVATQT
jgi:hypothetical protein